MKTERGAGAARRTRRYGQGTPDGSSRSGGLSAGFGQIEAQVLKVGMVAEVTYVSKPWMIIPMAVVGVQDYIAAGQFRGGEQLVDVQAVTRPGTILTFLDCNLPVRLGSCPLQCGQKNRAPISR
jgi:hypothetical protein